MPVEATLIVLLAALTVSVRFAVNAPPPVKPLPATTEREQLVAVVAVDALALI